MSNLDERTILQDGLVRITDRRTLIGTMSFSNAEIRSVKLTRRARSMRPLWLTAVGIFLLSWSVIDQTGHYREFHNWGIVLIALGIAFVILSKPTYGVRIGGASGQSDILRSSNRAFVEKVVEAINHAIAGSA